MTDTMERDLEDIAKECTEFMEIKRQYRYNKFPQAGSPCYIISRTWIKKYKNFINYKYTKKGIKFTIESDHCQKYHPGPISNEEDLLDSSEKNLKGTGQDETFEAVTIDKYLKSDVRERQQFKIYN